MKTYGSLAVPGGTLTPIPVPRAPVTYHGGDCVAQVERAHARPSSSPFTNDAPEFTREQLLAAGFVVKADGRKRADRARDRRIVELYTTGSSIRDVAAELHMSPVGVRGALARLDLETRTKSGTPKPRHPERGGAATKDLIDLLAANGLTTGDVRTWARANGHTVGTHGSIGRDVIEAYLLATRHYTTHQKEISA